MMSMDMFVGIFIGFVIGYFGGEQIMKFAKAVYENMQKNYKDNKTSKKDLNTQFNLI